MRHKLRRVGKETPRVATDRGPVLTPSSRSRSTSLEEARRRLRSSPSPVRDEVQLEMQHYRAQQQASNSTRQILIGESSSAGSRPCEVEAAEAATAAASTA